MKLRLSDDTVASAVCPPGCKDRVYTDETLRGFSLRVTSTGERIFLFRYRVGDKTPKVVLGTFGAELTTAKARRKAESLRGQVRDARDPVAERRATRAADIAADAAAKAAKAADSYTVRKLIQDWTDNHLSERSDSYRKSVPAQLRRVLKDWLDTPAKRFSRTDAVQALDTTKTGAGPIAANRARAESRSCWAWAVKRGTLDANPWEATPKPSKETSRERVLTDEEVGDLWAASGEIGNPWSALFRVLILTGQRRSEVGGMAWAELDQAKAEWALPAARTKNSRSHTVPMAPKVIELIHALPRRGGAEMVFEGPRQTAPSGFGKLKEKLDASMTARAAERGATLPAWTVHDIRRTVATGLQRLGVRLEVTEAVLNHVSGSRSGIVGVYQRHGWQVEKRAALEAWTAHVLACAGECR